MRKGLTLILMALAIMIIAVSCDNPHVHTFPEDWEKDETYHWHAATCGHDVVDGKEEHKFGDLIPDTPATETTTGKGHKVCSVCGYVKEGEVIPVVGHKHTPSSTYGKDDEYHWQVCSGCGDNVNIAKHTIECVSVNDLNHNYKCSVCSYVKTETHNIVETKYLATGKKEQSCTECSYKKVLADAVTEKAPVATTTVSGKTVNSGEVKIPANVTANESTSSPEEKTTVTFPAESLKMNGNAKEVSLTVKAVAITEVSSDNNYKVATTTSTGGAVVAGFEFTLSGADSSDFNGKGVTVSTYINPGLTLANMKILYTGTEKTGTEAKITRYDTSTGYLEYTVYHFSRYAIVSTDVVAVDEAGKIYKKLGDAVKTEATGNTITLLKDITLTDAITVPAGKSVTIDLNGKTITSTTVTDTILTNNGTLVLKNGTLDLSVTKETHYTFIANRNSLTTESVDIKTVFTGSSKELKYVYGVNNAGLNGGPATLVMNKNTKVSIAAGDGSTNVQPTAVYCIQNTSSTITNSEITAANNSGKTAYGFYVLVNDQGGTDGIDATGTLSGTKITVSNSGLGSVTPVFAESKEKSAKAEITLSNCVISSTSTCESGNSEKTVYGVRVKGPGYITLDESTADKITVNKGNGDSKTARFASEIQTQTYEVSAKGLYGKITIESTDERAVYTDAEAFDTLGKALDNVASSETILLLTNAELTKDVKISDGKNVTLDLCGNTITTGNRIVNNGTLTIKNGTIKSKIITGNNGAAALATSGTGTLTVDSLTLDVTFVDTTTDGVKDLVGIRVDSKGKARINSSTIEVESVSEDGETENTGVGKVMGVYSCNGGGVEIDNSDITVISTSNASSYGFYALLSGSNFETNGIENSLKNSQVAVSQSSVGSVSPVFAESKDENKKSTINITNGCTIKGESKLTTNENKDSSGNQKIVYAVRAKENGVINIDADSVAKCSVTENGTTSYDETRTLVVESPSENDSKKGTIVKTGVTT